MRVLFHLSLYLENMYGFTLFSCAFYVLYLIVFYGTTYLEDYLHLFCKKGRWIC